MFVRPITAAETERARQIDQIAFGFAPPADQKPAAEQEAWRKTRAAFDDQGQMTACLQLIPFETRLDGTKLSTGGIGGVASLPEGRGQGNVRALFELTLREMFDRGMTFSSLYPFSYAYYRKFGYELTHIHQRVYFPTDAVRPQVRVGGRFAQFEAGQEDGALRVVYERFLRDANLAMVRGDAEWKVRFDQQKERFHPSYTYVWYDEEDIAQAYFTYHHENANGERIMEIDDYAFAGKEGFTALLSMLHMLTAQYKHAVWHLPDWIQPHTLFPDPYDIEVKLVPRSMTRLVHVEKALSAMRYPRRPGSLLLGVRDPILPENDGNWSVSFGLDKVTVEKTQGGAKPDLSLDIRALTQLVVGSVSLPGLLLTRPDLSIHANEETLVRVFRRRRVFLADFF